VEIMDPKKVNFPGKIYDEIQKNINDVSDELKVEKLQLVSK
jgi:hypothetical protein